MDSTGIFNRYLAAINSHDVAALKSLMAENHQFVDSLGNRMRGAGSVETGWRHYFAMCTDYWIRADKLIGGWATVLGIDLVTFWASAYYHVGFGQMPA